MDEHPLHVLDPAGFVLAPEEEDEPDHAVRDHDQRTKIANYFAKSALNKQQASQTATTCQNKTRMKNYLILRICAQECQVTKVSTLGKNQKIKVTILL